MSILRIKRSEQTGNPPQLAQGELEPTQLLQVMVVIAYTLVWVLKPT